jgi:hypothetical protein
MCCGRYKAGDLPVYRDERVSVVVISMGYGYHRHVVTLLVPKCSIHGLYLTYSGSCMTFV